MDYPLSRQCPSCSSRDHRRSPRQEQISRCKTSEHCKFVWNWKVSHGGSTREENYNGAHVSLSRENKRFLCSACSFQRAYNPTLIGFPPSDNSLRDWHGFGYSLYSLYSRTQRRLYEFMYALLTVTRTELETILTEGEAWGEGSTIL